MLRPQFRRARYPRLEHLEGRTLLSATPTLDLAGVALNRSRLDPTHILVRYLPGQKPTALPGTTVGQALDLVPGLHEIRLDAGTSPEEAVAEYAAQPGVLTAEPDYALSVSWVPNDPVFVHQWGLRNVGQNGGTAGADIRAASAWDVIVGAARVPIAVIDSGIDYTHPDLYLNIWVNQREIPSSRRVNLIDVNGDGLINFRDLNDARNKGPGKITDLNGNGYIDAGDVLKPMVKDALGNDTGQGGWADGASQDGDLYVDDLVGWNANKNTNDPFDDYGHGTHVAGTIGAVGNNGVGVAGVGWMAQLVPVKFFNQFGQGSILQFIAGLDWALAKGIKVSNNSWVASGYTSILFDAVARARAKGHIVVAAAGNNARNTDSSPIYPAGLPLDNVVSVAATDRNDKLASFSNFGTASVDIAAPGVEIVSTNPGKSYGTRSGTSMATPHVTGTIALVWGLRPEWTYQQVINWVLATADRLPTLAGKTASGRLNAAAAVRVPPRGTPQPPTTRPASLAPAAARRAAALPSSWLAEFAGAGAAGVLESMLEAKKEKGDLFTQTIANIR